MPGRLKSVPLLEAVVATRPDLKVLVYTGHGHPSLALATLDIGARGCVLKASGPNVAIEAIRIVCDGGTFMDPAVDLESARSRGASSAAASARCDPRALAYVVCRHAASARRRVE